MASNREMKQRLRLSSVLAALVVTAGLMTGCGSSAPSTGTEASQEASDPGAVLYADIQEALDAAGDDSADMMMSAVTDVTDEGAYLRVHYQNPIADESEAEDLVREIYGFTTSDAFTDGETTTIVVRDSNGVDTNVWVTRDGIVAEFSTSPVG